MWHKSEPQTKSARVDSDFTLDNINVRAGSARVITKDGAGDLQVFRSPIGLTFLEVDPAVVDVTTVYAGVIRDGAFITVDTRHSALGDQANAQQYFGRCTVLQ